MWALIFFFLLIAIINWFKFHSHLFMGNSLRHKFHIDNLIWWLSLYFLLVRSYNWTVPKNTRPSVGLSIIKSKQTLLVPKKKSKVNKYMCILVDQSSKFLWINILCTLFCAYAYVNLADIFVWSIAGNKIMKSARCIVAKVVTNQTYYYFMSMMKVFRHL